MEATADNSISGIRLYPAADVITLPRFDGLTLPANQPLGYFPSAPIGHTASGEPVYSWELAIRSNARRKINEDTWLKGQALRAKQDAQSVELADRIQDLTGKSSYRPTMTWAQVDDTLPPEQWLLRPVVTFRNTNLIPSVARQHRNQDTVELRAYLEQRNREGYVPRYLVITSGPRCSASAIDVRRARLRRHASAIRKIAPDFGLEVVDLKEECTADSNKPTSEKFHPHGNLLVLAKSGQHIDYKGFNAAVSEVLGGDWWKDCGELKDVREYVKYVTKGDELAAMDDETLREYIHYYEGAHTVQAYGSYAAFRRELRESGEKYQSVFRDGDFHLVRVKRATRQALPEGAEASGAASVVAVTPPIPAFGPTLMPCVLIRGHVTAGNLGSIVRRSPAAMRTLEIMGECTAVRSPDRPHLHENSNGASEPPAEPPPGTRRVRQYTLYPSKKHHPLSFDPVRNPKSA